MASHIQQTKLTEICTDDEFNCRGYITPDTVVNLANDIREHGLIQPIIITDYKGDGDYKYELIAGFRRYLAHRVIKLDTIEAIYRPGLTRKEALIINLNENIQRKDLNIFQEAMALKKLMALRMSEAAVAKALNTSRGWVQVRFMLLKLPEAIQKEAEAGLINQQQIRDLYTLVKRQGNEAAYTAVKKLKEYKETHGSKKVASLVKDRKKKLNSTSKAPRSKRQILELLDHFQYSVGMGLHTRCLAWAIGEISSEELIDSIVEYADDSNIDYIRPNNL